MMEFVKATEEKVLVPLLQMYFTLEGKTSSSRDMKDLLNKELQRGREFFVLKEEKEVKGCVAVMMKGEEAELAYLVAREQGAETQVLEGILQISRQKGVTHFTSVIPKMHELLFVQKGFSLDRGRVCMEMKDSVVEQQANLQDQLQDLAQVEDIAGKTAEKLRRLRTRK